MAPSHPGLTDERKNSTGSGSARQKDHIILESGSATPASERRPSAGSGYFSPTHARMNQSSDHLATPNSSSGTSGFPRPSFLGSPDERDRSRLTSGRMHPLDSIGQSSLLPSSGRRRMHKDSNESNSSLFSFFRSPSRPPSPDYQDASSSIHTRKTSISGHSDASVNSNSYNGGSNNGGNVNRTPATPNSLGLPPSGSSSSVLNTAQSSHSFNSNNGNTANNSNTSTTSTYYYGNNISNNSINNSSATLIGNQGPNSQAHPTDGTSPQRRRSIDSYSRSSSPDQSEQQQANAHGQYRGQHPSTPPQMRPYQRTDSIKNALDAQHRRTKSTDFGEMYVKRPSQPELEPQQNTSVPMKESKKNIFSYFKKKTLLSHHHQNPSHGLQQHQQQMQQHYYLQHQPNQQQLYQPSSSHPQPQYSQSDRSRKCSTDDQYSPPTYSTSALAFSTAIFPDNDHYHGAHGYHEKRYGGDSGDVLRTIPYMSTGKKTSKKDSLANEMLLPGLVVDLGDSDMSGIKQDPKHVIDPWPLATRSGSQAWHAPESWAVAPPSSVGPGARRRSKVPAPNDPAVDEMDQSDLESWDYGQEKLSTIRIFREDLTYTTVNCEFNISAKDLSAILGKKVFKPDTSKYHLHVERNGIKRQLDNRERPLNILRRGLLLSGYTDQDKLEELSGKDNSFICRFTFIENGTPLITESDFPENTDYSDVNLQGRCLPTVPIFLHSKAREIVRLDVSHNQRMDLPLDFLQNCLALQELRMAHNDMDRVPVNVRSITRLEVLDLRGNRIKTLENARLEEAQLLVMLHLQSNRLETIPDSYHTLQYLRVLNLSGNYFSKFPNAICQITSLMELDLSFNDITEIPEAIGQLIRLRRLSLYGNRIGPYLPKSMENLTQLRKLDIRQNGISNLEAINGLPSLEELLVDYNTNVTLNNSFKSLIRASFLKCNMTDLSLRETGDRLTYLDISSNKLSNLAPNLFEHLRSLEQLKMDNNSISSIPGTIGALKRLKSLSIANNLLSALPDDIGNLESLLVLDVHSNNLGELPVAIWRCSLTSLNASSNLLESFPDPPKNFLPAAANGVPISSSSSSTTLSDDTLVQTSPGTATAISSRTKPLPVSPTPMQGTLPNRSSFSPPLATSLLNLFLGDNRLPDEVMFPISLFTNLRVLNVSHNYIAEIPRGKIPNPSHLVELYLGGNQLTSLPAEDIERLRDLLVLHVNGNKLTTLPAELGKIIRLVVLDVGCNMLKYNISNWPYDWNWNWNLELTYLNMSGNKRLQIKRQNAEGVPMATRPGNLSEFSNLTHLRILGLMDVTITDNVPENSSDRRVRTSMSTLHNMSYGMADTLGNSGNLCIWDLVHPKFQTKEDESLFGLFDGRSDKYASSSIITHELKDQFGAYLKIELEKLEGTDTVVSALRRTFLSLDRDLLPRTKSRNERGGASALIAYIKGTTLYSANVGDAIAVLVKKSDDFQVISQKHIPWNPTEASRIKRSGGFVSENGLLNDELDISRAFGQYHLVPIVNSNPYIETTALSEDDDFLIMASRAFWDVMSYNTAVDIAKAGKRDTGDLMYASQKLRDIAISYGAKGHMVVMLIGVGDLFKKKESHESTEYQQQNYKRPKITEGPADALKYLKPEIEPPQGEVAMVFTDIKNSTKLWESIPISMAIAIKEHFILMRRQLRSIGGYEVKNEGDALMASFSSVPAAMLWCFKVQELLVMADWPQDVLDSNECRAIYSPSNSSLPMYRGLSVRMGIHWGRPVSDRDAVTRRMDYYGPMVNRASRICDAADGGEICISSDVISVIQQLLADPDLEESDSPHAEHVRELKKLGFTILGLGERKLKGLETPENLHLIYSHLLEGRISMTPNKANAVTPVLETQHVENTLALDPASIRSLLAICLRLERLASGAVAQHGRASEQDLSLLMLPIKDNADQDELARVAENTITRIENCFSRLYMTKSRHFVDVIESLGRAIDTDPSYILRALQMYVDITGQLDI